MQGRIYKGVGGFYYVKTEDGNLCECKPRGIFRKRGIKPLAGDWVTMEMEAGSEHITEIHERKNYFVRPPVANVDVLFVVASTTEPLPNTLTIDKLLAVAVDQHTTPVLLITKTDLAGADQLLKDYASPGFEVLVVDAETEHGLDDVRRLLKGNLGVFAGNTGVGKSTLLNALLGEDERETGEISQKLGRGRHTTREVEIYEVGGGLIADTPGFTSFELQGKADILPENMQIAFPDVAAFMPYCKFSGCSHVSEPGCAVREALKDGDITESRYNNYVTLYQQAKELDRY